MSYNFARLIKAVGTKKYRLEVWQDAPLTEDRLRPYYFKAHYLLETKDEARIVLQLMGVVDLSKTA